MFMRRPRGKLSFSPFWIWLGLGLWTRTWPRACQLRFRLVIPRESPLTWAPGLRRLQLPPPLPGSLSAVTGSLPWDISGAWPLIFRDKLLFWITFCAFFSLNYFAQMNRFESGCQFPQTSPLLRPVAGCCYAINHPFDKPGPAFSALPSDIVPHLSQVWKYQNFWKAEFIFDSDNYVLWMDDGLRPVCNITLQLTKY